MLSYPLHSVGFYRNFYLRDLYKILIFVLEVDDYRWMINEHTDLSFIETSYSFARFRCLLLRLVYHSARRHLKSLALHN